MKKSELVVGKQYGMGHGLASRRLSETFISFITVTVIDTDPKPEAGAKWSDYRSSTIRGMNGQAVEVELVRSGTKTTSIVRSSQIWGTVEELTEIKKAKEEAYARRQIVDRENAEKRVITQARIRDKREQVKDLIDLGVYISSVDRSVSLPLEKVEELLDLVIELRGKNAEVNA